MTAIASPAPPQTNAAVARREQRKSQLRELIDRERKFERRVRGWAASAWGGVLVTLPAGLMLLAEARGEHTDGERAARLDPAGTLLVGFGGVFLVLAILATIGWLFRTRTPTLAAIESRLADLEELVRSGSPGA